MKKILLSLFVGSLFLFNSCTKEYNDYYDLVPTITMVYERFESDWTGTDNDASVKLPVPELDQYYMDQGIVTIAMSVNNEKSYHIIPAVINGVSYSSEYKKGEITIFAQDPVLGDYYVEVPQKVIFKVSLTESDWVE